MRHLRIAMSSLMIFAFDPLTAHAQTKPKPKLHIIVEELSENDLKCGMRKETIKDSATLVLRRNGIDASNNSTLPFLYIGMNSLMSNDGWCSYYLRIAIVDSEIGKQRNGCISKSDTILLCEKDVIARSLKSDMNKTLSDQTEDLLKSCLVMVEY